MEDELLELLADTITIAPTDGTFDDRGVPGYGTAVSYICRIEPMRGEEMIRGPEGDERKAKWKIFVQTTSALDPDGQLTLPAGFDPQQPPFFAVGREADQTGAHHYVILV